MATVNTTVGTLDESLLIKREGQIDNDDESTTTVEYCLVGCKGASHITGVPDSTSFFCDVHVHRSVHITLKKVPTLAGATGQFV